MGRFKPLELRVKELHCTLTRLDDHRYAQLEDNSLAIREDHGFLMDLMLNARRRGELLSLGEIYAAFKDSFGESGRCFDDYKGAFSFPFEVTVHKGEALYLYLLNVVNWRGTVEFRFRKVISPDDRGLNRMVVHPPFAAEFSVDEINTVVAYLYGFAQGVIEAFLRLHYPFDEFVKKVDSNLILFGFRQGAFFEEKYGDSDELMSAWKEATAKLSTGVFDATAGLRSRLVDRFGPLPDWVEAWMGSAEPTQIEAWTRRMSDAQDLASVFDVSSGESETTPPTVA
jgi:hypothetical protein